VNGFSKRAALVALTLFVAARAHAAGLGQPNIAGPRAIGLGGAFTAIADDPTAVWHNPAGPAFFGENQAYLGAEMTIPIRTYTPDATSPLGMVGQTKTISENVGATPLPMVGVSSRFGFGKTKPTRFALSLLTHLAFGGAIAYKETDIQNTATQKASGLINTQILDYEITPALSYQITDVLAVGAGLRIGINAFSVDDQEAAFRATLSNTGVGIGGTLGVLIKPHRMVDIGLTYRTPLSATMTGGGPVVVTGQPTSNKDSSLAITWPQSAALGVAVKPHWRILASLQADWTGWSSVQKLNPALMGIPDATTTRQMRFNDVFTIHAGVQAVINRHALVRLGYTWDGNAIPDSTVRRENQDGTKNFLSAGLGLHVWRLYLDGAFQILIPGGERVVGTQVNGPQAPDNEAGSYKAQAYTLALSGNLHF
jgi:long-chain fatty acid transport protein